MHKGLQQSRPIPIKAFCWNCVGQPRQMNPSVSYVPQVKSYRVVAVKRAKSGNGTADFVLGQLSMIQKWCKFIYEKMSRVPYYAIKTIKTSTRTTLN